MLSDRPYMQGHDPDAELEAKRRRLLADAREEQRRRETWVVLAKLAGLIVGVALVLAAVVAVGADCPPGQCRYKQAPGVPPPYNTCIPCREPAPTTTTTPGPTTPPTTLPCNALAGQLCDRDGTPRRCCDDAPYCWGRPADHETCHATPEPTVTPTTQPKPTTTTLPGTFRFELPTGKDVSIRLTQRGDRCKWIAGRTATQVERAAMYLYGTAKLQPEGHLYAKYHPTCAANEGELETDDTRLRVFYIDPRRNKVWNILSANGCPDYQHVHNLGVRLAQCSTASEAAKRWCATSLLMTGDLLDFADLRIEAGKCERGARFVLSLPGHEDLALARLGMLDYRVPLPVSAAFRAVVRDVVAVHHDVDHAFCDGAASPPGVVQAATARCLAAPGMTPEERHACLLVFTAARDEGGSGWDRQAHCDWKMLEGASLTAWEGCLAKPPLDVWPCLTRTRVTHETLHRCAAFANDGDVRIGNHDDVQLTARAKETCAAFLRCQTGEKPGCRRPWVPATWRVLAPPAGPL